MLDHLKDLLGVDRKNIGDDLDPKYRHLMQSSTGTFGVWLVIGIAAALIVFVAYYGMSVRVSDLERLNKEQAKEVTALESELARLKSELAGLGEDTTNLHEQLQSQLQRLNTQRTSKAVDEEQLKPRVTKPFGIRVKGLDDLQVELVHCKNKPKYLYCDVIVSKLDGPPRSVKISSNNAYVRASSGRTYSNSDFNFERQSETWFRANKSVGTTSPFRVRYRFYDPPSNLEQFAAVRLKIDDKSVTFRNVVVQQ